MLGTIGKVDKIVIIVVRELSGKFTRLRRRII